MSACKQTSRPPHPFQDGSSTYPADARWQQFVPATRLMCRPMDFRKLLVTPHASLRGHYLYERFVTPAEEAELVQMVETTAPAWHTSTFNGRHRYVLKSCTPSYRDLGYSSSHHCPKHYVHLERQLSCAAVDRIKYSRHDSLTVQAVLISASAEKGERLSICSFPYACMLPTR